MKRLTKEEINSKIYPYVLNGTYLNSKTPTSFYCPLHYLYFTTLPIVLFNKEGGCKLCKNNYKSKIISKGISVDKIDFSKSIREKQTFICQEHGEFISSIFNVLKNKYGCPKCSKHHFSSIEWKEYATKLRGKDFDYSKSNYSKCNEKIEIICKKCNTSFWQTPENHLNKFQGCPNCTRYKGEEKIKKELEENNISYIRNKTFDDLKDSKLLSYDFYIEKYNLLIEFNGIQHYSYNSYFYKNLHDWHKQLHHDWLKRRYAFKHNINLLIIKG